MKEKANIISGRARSKIMRKNYRPVSTSSQGKMMDKILLKKYFQTHTEGGDWE